MEPRKVRAYEIAKQGALRKASDHLWLVPSQSHTGTYVVDFSGEEPTCTCPDFETRSRFCKHIFSVEIFRNRPDMSGPVVEIKDERNWVAYNASLRHEKEHVFRLGHSLFFGSQYPGADVKTRGCPRKPLPDVLLGLLVYVYGLKGARQTQFDLDHCHEKGLLSTQLHYNSMLRYLQDPTLTPILRGILQASAEPFRFIETRFAIDATGFSTHQWERWSEEKWGAHRGDDSFALLRRELPSMIGEDPMAKEIKSGPRKVRRWLKAHACVGTATHICTDVAVASVGDAVMFPELVRNTAQHFRVREITADKAYSSYDNLEVADEIGAIPFIPFRAGTGNRGGPPIWRRMSAYYTQREEQFLAHYHARSQVETTFGSVKTKFGGHVRTKVPVAQQNEIYLKFLAHNLCVCTRAIYELGETPEFWKAS